MLHKRRIFVRTYRVDEINKLASDINTKCLVGDVRYENTKENRKIVIKLSSEAVMEAVCLSNPMLDEDLSLIEPIFSVKTKSLNEKHNEYVWKGRVCGNLLMYRLEVLDFIDDFNKGNVAGLIKTLTQKGVQKRQEKTIPKPSFFKSTRDWGKSSRSEKSSGSKESTISKMRTCPICNGNGFDGHCYKCLGRGWID
jgi:hypothetical protein